MKHPRVRAVVGTYLSKNPPTSQGLGYEPIGVLLEIMEKKMETTMAIMGYIGYIHRTHCCNSGVVLRWVVKGWVGECMPLK